ncbi:dNA internalization-related competence protein ComEC/Rec2 [Clostridium sp. CAG:793]|nr:dNA internalization-related competence protein ComEC/Rec2 [Clostridium sp. CAG:793]
MKNRIICVFAIFLVILTIILNKIGYEFGKYEGKKEGVFYAKVISEAEEKNYVYSYQAEIDNKKFILYISKDVEKLEYGSIIKINAQYTEATRDRNYGGFNYKTYLRTKKIYGIFNVENVEIVKNGSDNIIIKLRKYIKSKLREKLKKENSELAISLIVGDRSHISSEVEDNFKKANLMHMLAISGAHFSYVILIATFISNRLQHKRLGQLIQIIAIIFFMNLTGNTASVVRAGIMSILLIGSSICKRQNDSLNNIAISAIIQIINNPYIIFDSGFMLSYLGVLGIILFYKKISEHIHFKSIALTISANIFIIPIMIYNFHTISGSFIISNICASWLLGIIIILEFISLCIPIKLLYMILDLLIMMLRKIAEICANIPFAQMYVPRYAIFFVIVIYILIFCRKLKCRKYVYSFLTIGVSILLIVNFTDVYQDRMRINFIDVGQGDSCLIRYKGTNIMIDSGGSLSKNKDGKSYDIGENVLNNYLLNRGITRLDYIMASHFDEDHSQGFVFLLKNMKVKNVIISEQYKTSSIYEQFKQICKKQNIQIIYVKSGDEIRIKDLAFKILHPKSKENQISENPLNNNAIVCMVKYKNRRILFTGDIEKVAENEMVKEYTNGLKADILKVGHHGSKTSTTKEFLDLINPSVALIGVGQNNKFGHPNEDVIKRLEEKNIQIYRTDEMGEISVIIDKNGKIKINTHI